MALSERTEVERILTLIQNLSERLAKIEERDIANVQDLPTGATAIVHTHESADEGGVALNPESIEIEKATEPTLTLNETAGNSVASGKVSFVSGGAENASIEYNANADYLHFDTFNVDNALVIDRVTGNIGLGAIAPASILEFNLATEDLEVVDAGSTAATEQDWIQVEIGGNIGYIRVFAAK